MSLSSLSSSPRPDGHTHPPPRANQHHPSRKSAPSPCAAGENLDFAHLRPRQKGTNLANTAPGSARMEFSGTTRVLVSSRAWVGTRANPRRHVASIRVRRALCLRSGRVTRTVDHPAWRLVPLRMSFTCEALCVLRGVAAHRLMVGGCFRGDRSSRRGFGCDDHTPLHVEHHTGGGRCRRVC